MSGPEIESVQPTIANLDPGLTGALASSDTLLLGPPLTGKSVILEESRARTVESLEAAIEVDPDEPVAIDQFYRAVMGADPDVREQFRSWLDRPGAVTLATTVRRLDWLVRETGTLDATLLERFDRALFLQFDADDIEQRERAINEAVAIGSDNQSDLTIDPGAIDDHLEAMIFERPSPRAPAVAELIDDESVADRIVVPATIEYITETAHDENDTILTPDAIRSMLADLPESIGGSALYATGTDLGTTVLAGLGLAAKSSFGIAHPAIAAGGLLGSLVLSDDGLDPQAVTSALFDASMTPLAVAEFEAAFDLPPRTITNARRLTDEHTTQTIQEVCEEYRSTGGFEELADRLETHVERLANFAEMTSDHDARMAAAPLYSEYIDDAIATDADVARDLKAEETTLLEGLVGLDPTDAAGTQSHAAYLEAIDDRFDLTDMPFAHEGDDPIDAIADAIESDTDVIQVEGPHGTGKTTAIYRACQRLPEEYALAAPTLRYSDEFLTTRLERGLDAERPVVYVEIALSDRGNAIDGQADLRRLFGWLDSGHCDTIVVECRQELAAGPEDWGTAVDRGRWSARERVTLEAFDDETTTRTIVDWIARLVDRGNAVNAVFPEVHAIADGSPEIAKLATRFALHDEYDLADVHTADDLIEEDLRSFFGATTGVRGTAWRVLVTLSVVGGLTTADLQSVLAIDRGTLGRAGRHLLGYLGDIETDIWANEHRDEAIDADAVWTIAPDIYAETIFRYSLLEAEEVRYADVRDSVYEDGDFDDHLPYTARQFAVAFDAVRQREESEATAAICDRADEFVEWVCERAPPDGTLTRCLRQLTVGGVPVDPDPFAEYSEVIRADAAAEDDQRDMRSGSFLYNILGNLVGAHLVVESPQVETVSNIAHQIARQDDEDGPSPEVFLENVYSMALEKLADGTDDPAAVEPWIRRLDRLATQSATIHPDGKAVFLENVYSIALKNLADGADDPAAVEPWIQRFDRLATQSATIDPDGKEVFLMNVYSMALANLADRADDPAAVEPWIRRLDRLATHSATIDPDGKAVFLENVYIMALATLADGADDPAAVEPWIRRLDRLATQSAPIDPDGKAEFEAAYHAWALLRSLTAAAADPDAWRADRLERVTDRIDTDHLDRFYVHWLQSASQSSQREEIPRIVEDVIDRFGLDDRPGLSDDDRRSIIVPPTAHVAAGVGIEGGTSHPYFHRIARSISRIDDADALTLESLLTAVIDRLEDANLDEGFIDILDADPATVIDPLVTATYAVVLADRLAEDGTALTATLAEIRSLDGVSDDVPTRVCRRALLDHSSAAEIADVPAAPALVAPPGVADERLDAHLRSLADRLGESSDHGLDACCWLVETVIDADRGSRPAQAAVVASAVAAIDDRKAGLDNAIGRRVVKPIDDPDLVAAVAERLESDAFHFDFDLARRWRQFASEE